mgnify:CR=1 FL=1
MGLYGYCIMIKVLYDFLNKNNIDLNNQTAYKYNSKNYINDVQKVYIAEKYPDLEKEQNRPIASFWDHVFPFDINNMTDCEE